MKKVSLHILDYNFQEGGYPNLIFKKKKTLHNSGREMNSPLDGVWDKWEKSVFVEVICLRKHFNKVHLSL